MAKYNDCRDCPNYRSGYCDHIRGNVKDVYEDCRNCKV